MALTVSLLDKLIDSDPTTREEKRFSCQSATHAQWFVKRLRVDA